VRRIAIIVNCGKANASAVIRRAETCAGQLGLELYTCDQTSTLLPSSIKVTPAEIPCLVDAVLAIGGDGTLLHAARTLNGADIPIIGVNLGSLGFMTSVPEENLEKTMDALRRDNVEPSRRTMLDCVLQHGGEEMERWTALNDIVVGWGSSSRIITLDIAVDGQNVTRTMCDGLIVSTPTGSTGHSMSAGGPIVHPETPAFLITIICPHTLSNRPLIISDTNPVDVTVSSAEKSLLLAIDGQDRYQINQGDCIHIEKADTSLQLLHLPEYRYFDILKHKLHWSGSVV